MSEQQHSPAVQSAGLSALGQRLMQQLRTALTSRNVRMQGEGTCRLCGICHHVCGLTGALRPRNGSED